jgi:carboxyl-terminal processing protease
MVDLNKFARKSQPQFGELKMTVAQFFRIDGGTTQLRGVTPDILFPSASDAQDFGEASFDNALPWTQIKPADYVPVADLKPEVPVLEALHQARIKKDQDFRDLQDDIATAEQERKKNLVSLNEAARRKERDAQEARLASRDARKDSGKSAHDDARGKASAAKGGALRDDGLQANERNLADQLAAEKSRKDAKDVFLDEAVHILGDEVGVSRAPPRLADRVKTVPALLPD